MQIPQNVNFTLFHHRPILKQLSNQSVKNEAHEKKKLFELRIKEVYIPHLLAPPLLEKFLHRNSKSEANVNKYFTV